MHASIGIFLQLEVMLSAFQGFQRISARRKAPSTAASTYAIREDAHTMLQQIVFKDHPSTKQTKQLATHCYA